MASAERKRRRGHGEGSIYHRKDGRWEARLDLGWIDGKRTRVSHYGRTRQEVSGWLGLALGDLQRGIAPPLGRQTVGEHLLQWLEQSVKPSVRPSTFTSYALLVRRHLIPELGPIPMVKLHPQHVQRLLNAKLAEGLSPRTVQYIRAVLRHALNQALRWGEVGRNVATLVDAPRSVRYTPMVLTADQLRILLRALAAERLGVLHTLTVLLGLRQGEALGLRWSDVDLDRGTLTVNGALQRIDGAYHLVEPKTPRSRRTLALWPRLVALLTAHRGRQRSEQSPRGRTPEIDGLVFTTVLGRPLDGATVTHDLQRILVTAGLPRLRYHDLRHTCASLLVQLGVHPRGISGVLGHDQIGTTMNVYAHLVPAVRAEIAEAMDRLVGEAEEGRS